VFGNRRIYTLPSKLLNNLTQKQSRLFFQTVALNSEMFKNLSGKSGIDSYEIGDAPITVTFKIGNFRTYVYDYVST
jgi:hypothetical protein